MEKNKKEYEKMESNNMTTMILKKCGIQYWTYYPGDNSAAPGTNIMEDLVDLKSWDNYPQKLISLGLIHKNSVTEWLRMHERIKAGEPDLVNEILVIEGGAPIWKKIQYHTEFDETGKPVSATGIAENISSYKNLAKNYVQAAKQCGVTIWMFDLKSKMIYDMNNATHKTSFDTYTTIQNVPEVYIGPNSLLCQEDAPAMLEMFRKIYEGEKTASSIGRWWNEAHDNWWWYEISYTTLFDEDGKPVQAIGTGMDVSERIRLEERYREESKWRQIHNQDVLGSYKMNLTKNTCEDGQSDNPKILTFQGNGTVDGFFAREYTTHIEPEELKEYKKIFNRKNMLKNFYKGKTSFTKESYVDFENRPPLWVRIELDMFLNPKNGDVEAYIYAADIDQKKTNQALVDTVVNMDYDYLAMLDMVTDGYTIFSKTKNKTPLPSFYASNYKDEVEQYARKFLVEEDIEQNIYDLSYENLLEQLENQEIYTTYCRVKELDGSISRKKLQFSYLDEKRKKIIAARTDITVLYNEEQQKNEALRDALIAAQQASTAKSEFLSRMSHEIRTPMNTIIGMSALAAGCVNDPEQVSEYLSKVGISARFLLSLINDVLDMSRIESGKVFIHHDEIPFEEFIKGVNSICYTQAQQKGIEYDAILTSYTEDIYIGDAMKLQQILVNIIANAIKFTPAGGKVQFMIHQEKIGQNEALMKFTINDTGIGINEKFLPQLFEPFEQQCSGSTTPYGGTGLGLAICNNLVNLMGGKINVNSIEGVGSEFIVEVKLGIQERSKQLLQSNVQLHLEKLRALIVDDDIIVCRHTQEILQDMCIKADYVASGAKAVEVVREKWKRNSAYDIILVDWKMPDMDGIETTKQIRKIVGPEVTIIIITAYDWAAIEVEAKEAGVNMLISKPLFQSSLGLVFEKIYSEKERSLLPIKPYDYDFSGKRVLLVEDHLLNIEVAKKLLSAKHLEVEIAENGLRAIEIFAQTKVGYYDAILMDIRMPVMDGLTATKSIRQMRKGDATTIPIIAMTANAFDEDIEKTKDAGMNAHLAKPIEPQILYQTIQYFLNREEV
ncbi:MAG: response regulator [Lachnospiraceae bacterium]